MNTMANKMNAKCIVFHIFSIVRKSFAGLQCDGKWNVNIQRQRLPRNEQNDCVVQVNVHSMYSRPVLLTHPLTANFLFLIFFFCSPFWFVFIIIFIQKLFQTSPLIRHYNMFISYFSVSTFLYASFSFYLALTSKTLVWYSFHVPFGHNILFWITATKIGYLAMCKKEKKSNQHADMTLK